MRAGNRWRPSAWCCKCASTAGALCPARSGEPGSGRALCGSPADCLPALPLCKCPPLCHHATHEVSHCALPCANALPWGVMQTPCPEALCKCPPLCHHATHEVSHCALPCANALPWGVMQTPCPEALCKCPPLCHHASHEVGHCALPLCKCHALGRHANALP